MTTILRFLCLNIASVFVLSIGLTNVSAQESFPSKPIRIIVGFTPGTGSDVVARVVSQSYSTILGQSIIIENKPGAGGMLGPEFGAKAAPDGYTLTLASAGGLIIAPAMSKSPPKYKAEKDFVPIGGLAKSAFVVVTANTADAPQSFQELVTRLKDKGGNFGSPGTGTTTHLVGEVLLKQAGVKATHIPYRGSAQAMTDTASGQVGFSFDTVAGALPLIRAGKLRALAVTSADRITSLPSVQTVSESGVSGFSVVGWWGLLAPAGTPQDVVTKLSDALIKSLNNPQTKSSLSAQEVEPYPLASAAFGALIQKEAPMWTELVKENKLVSD